MCDEDAPQLITHVETTPAPIPDEKALCRVPIAVTKANGWKGNSAMVARYYREMHIANEDIVLKR